MSTFSAFSFFCIIRGRIFFLCLFSAFFLYDLLPYSYICLLLKMLYFMLNMKAAGIVVMNNAIRH